MKPFFLIGLGLLISIKAQLALATCDGIPYDIEKYNCSTPRDRNSCELIPGCKWTPEPAFIRLCNHTDKKISIAIQQIRPNHNRIAEEGWWNLEIGQCQDFEAPNATSFGYFAKSFHGHHYWYGNGQPMCYDASGKRFENTRHLSENSCGDLLTEIQAFQTIPVKQDDFFQIKIEGSGVDLSPAPEENVAPVNPALTARAMAWCPATGEYSVREGTQLEEAKARALSACQSTGNTCELVLWLGQDRPACMAILSGAGIFRAWGWSYEGKEAAIHQALQHCQKSGQNCTVDFTVCN